MNRRAQQRLLVMLIAGFILLLAGSFKLVKPLGAAAAIITNPITHNLQTIGQNIANSFSVITTARHLASDNARLKQENADLRKALVAASAGANELAAIKKELGLRQTPGKRLIPADVVSTQPDSYRSYIQINRGRQDGIRKDMVVVLDGSLVGVVSEAGDLSSKVILVTDANFVVNAQALRNSAASGTVYGNIGGGLRMEKIPQDQAIAVGDSVITSGLGGVIAKGYSLGTIQSVKKADNGVFQSAVLATPVQIAHLQTVFVVGD